MVYFVIRVGYGDVGGVKKYAHNSHINDSAPVRCGGRQIPVFTIGSITGVEALQRIIIRFFACWTHDTFDGLHIIKRLLGALCLLSYPQRTLHRTEASTMSGRIVLPCATGSNIGCVHIVGSVLRRLPQIRLDASVIDYVEANQVFEMVLKNFSYG